MLQHCNITTNKEGTNLTGGWCFFLFYHRIALLANSPHSFRMESSPLRWELEWSLLFFHILQFAIFLRTNIPLCLTYWYSHSSTKNIVHIDARVNNALPKIADMNWQTSNFAHETAKKDCHPTILSDMSGQYINVQTTEAEQLTKTKHNKKLLSAVWNQNSSSATWHTPHSWHQPSSAPTHARQTSILCQEQGRTHYWRSKR